MSQTTTQTMPPMEMETYLSDLEAYELDRFDLDIGLFDPQYRTVGYHRIPTELVEAFMVPVWKPIICAPEVDMVREMMKPSKLRGVIRFFSKEEGFKRNPILIDCESGFNSRRGENLIAVAHDMWEDRESRDDDSPEVSFIGETKTIAVKGWCEEELARRGVPPVPGMRRSEAIDLTESPNTLVNIRKRLFGDDELI